MAKTRRDHDCVEVKRAKRRNSAPPSLIQIPGQVDHLEISFGDRQVKLTNLNKLFWPELGITKRDLLQYYTDVSHVLLPHLQDRAMVMKRYPSGAAGPFFFQKRAPIPRPKWIDVCAIEHSSKSVIEF